MISIYGTMYACSNLIRVFNKGYETITAEALMLLITVYPVYALNADVQQRLFMHVTYVIDL